MRPTGKEVIVVESSSWSMALMSVAQIFFGISLVLSTVNQRYYHKVLRRMELKCDLRCGKGEADQADGD